VAAFQERVGLPATARADDVTVARVVAETTHRHVATSAMRALRLGTSESLSLRSVSDRFTAAPR
jgi:hypothetical protein